MQFWSLLSLTLAGTFRAGRLITAGPLHRHTRPSGLYHRGDPTYGQRGRVSFHAAARTQRVGQSFIGGFRQKARPALNLLFSDASGTPGSGSRSLLSYRSPSSTAAHRAQFHQRFYLEDVVRIPSLHWSTHHSHTPRRILSICAGARPNDAVCVLRAFPSLAHDRGR